MPTATVNGVHLSYRIEGEGPPIVLAHGFSTGHYVWDATASRLAERFQVVRHDHRGHCDSSKPPGPYRIQDFVDDLAALLNYLGLERVDLVGHSMGGRTALLFALNHPDRLNRLLLVGASGAAPEGAPGERFEALKKLAIEEGMAAVFDSDLFSFALPEAWKKNPASARERFLKNTPEGFCAAADAVLTMPDLRGRLGEIDAPVWACTGETDAGPMAFNELLEERIASCTRAVISNCGHYPMLDAAEEFLAGLEGFLESAPGGGLLQEVKIDAHRSDTIHRKTTKRRPDHHPQGRKAAFRSHRLCRLGRGVEISATWDRVKTRNLKRDPRANLCVLPRNGWYPYITAEGVCELLDDPGGRLNLDLYRRITGGDPDDMDEYLEAMARDGRHLIRLRIERLYPLDK